MSEPTVTNRDDTPAVALGPIALVLGVFSAVGIVAPLFTLYTLPWSIIAGGLALALGSMGIHHARRGAGRLWTAVAGTVLGGLGLVYVFWLFL